jgi:hypothetical protein
MSGQDEPITFREKAIIEATAKATTEAVMEKLTTTYDPSEYGRKFMDDYFSGITAETHITHHKWIANASTGRATQDISWADFWYSLAKGAAAVVVGFIGLAVLWAVIQYLRAGVPTIPGVGH